MTWLCDSDAGSTYTSGPGLLLNGTEFSVAFGADGVASSVARSDHQHFGQTWSGSTQGLTIQTTGAFPALRGDSSSNSGSGLHGTSPSLGVLGQASQSIGENYGVRGESSSTSGYGVHGINLASTGFGNGVYGRTLSDQGSAVRGWASAATGTAIGVVGQSAADKGIGVYGWAQSSSGTDTAGVKGVTEGHGAGVFGEAKATSGITSGVRGASASPDGYGVVGMASASSGINYGVLGVTLSPNGFAGGFMGNVKVTGNLSATGNVDKAGGTFKIDHPLDPENKYLLHSFVESPDMMNIYNGNIVTGKDGFATVEMPDWFEALNTEFRYQLTVIGSFAQAIVAEKMQHGRFVIRTNQPGVEVSWQVTGVRQDPWAEANRVQVEVQKSASERGKYLHPEVWGQPAEKAIGGGFHLAPQGPH
jgi:hypothetical protein